MKTKEKKKKTIEYTDLLQDEFSTAQITPRRIDGSYRYDRSAAAHWFWYRGVATPLAACYLRGKFHHRVIGREKLREVSGQGFFLYGNHTQIVADALIPTFVTYPTHASVIVHPNNVSMPFLGRVTPYMGALPLPDDADAAAHFLAAIRHRLQQKQAVVIYPEAHIWPYYIGIRPFTDASFLYPLQQNAPVFCFTNVYKKPKHGEHPNIETYLDGPFYPDASLPLRARRRALRDAVYQRMCERAACSDCEYICYRPKEESP